MEAPDWISHTISGLVGVGVTLVTVTLRFGNVERDAKDAKRQAEEHEGRLRLVERSSSLSEQSILTLLRRVDEVASDVRELLEFRRQDGREGREGQRR